jgi:putative membrane protein insertion efficiency factor
MSGSGPRARARRRAAWAAGAPLRAVLILGIRLYRATLSGWLGGQCRFSPTCSEYAMDAIASRGAIAGSALAAWRIARCNPFGAGGIDPVPPRSSDRGPLVYENVIHNPTSPEAHA